MPFPYGKHHNWPSTSILCALSAALASLRLPILLQSPELAFLGAFETQNVFAKLEDTFGDGGWHVEDTPEGLFNSLEGIANEALLRCRSLAEDAQLDPSWVEGLDRWFNRAVMLLTERLCTKPGNRHAGVHLHGEEFYCGGPDFDAEDLGNEGENESEDEPAVTTMAELTDLCTGQGWTIKFTEDWVARVRTQQ